MRSLGQSRTLTDRSRVGRMGRAQVTGAQSPGCLATGTTGKLVLQARTWAQADLSSPFIRPASRCRPPEGDGLENSLPHRPAHQQQAPRALSSDPHRTILGAGLRSGGHGEFRSHWRWHPASAASRRRPGSGGHTLQLRNVPLRPSPETLRGNPELRAQLSWEPPGTCLCVLSPELQGPFFGLCGPFRARATRLTSPTSVMSFLIFHFLY